MVLSIAKKWLPMTAVLLLLATSSSLTTRSPVAAREEKFFPSATDFASVCEGQLWYLPVPS